MQSLLPGAGQLTGRLESRSPRPFANPRSQQRYLCQCSAAFHAWEILCCSHLTSKPANTEVSCILYFMQHAPSTYLAQMRMNTEERLATITEMYPPTITELLDIAASSHQKVPPSKATSEYVPPLDSLLTDTSN